MVESAFSELPSSLPKSSPMKACEAVYSCPRCRSHMEPVGCAFKEDGSQMVWWTCANVQEKKCSYPLSMPPSVFWVTRTAEEVLRDVFPPPRLDLLPPKYYHLYPSLFHTDSSPSSSKSETDSMEGRTSPSAWLLSESDSIGCWSSSLSKTGTASKTIDSSSEVSTTKTRAKRRSQKRESLLPAPAPVNGEGAPATDVSLSEDSMRPADSGETGSELTSSHGRSEVASTASIWSQDTPSSSTKKRKRKPRQSAIHLNILERNKWTVNRLLKRMPYQKTMMSDTNALRIEDHADQIVSQSYNRVLHSLFDKERRPSLVSMNGCIGKGAKTDTTPAIRAAIEKLKLNVAKKKGMLSSSICDTPPHSRCGSSNDSQASSRSAAIHAATESAPSVEKATVRSVNSLVMAKFRKNISESIRLRERQALQKVEAHEVTPRTHLSFSGYPGNSGGYLNARPDEMVESGTSSSYSSLAVPNPYANIGYQPQMASLTHADYAQMEHASPMGPPLHDYQLDTGVHDDAFQPQMDTLMPLEPTHFPVGTSFPVERESVVAVDAVETRPLSPSTHHYTELASVHPSEHGDDLTFNDDISAILDGDDMSFDFHAFS